MNTAMSFLRHGESSRNLNDSFFPTPEKLADDLLCMVKWDRVVDVLEPSAGKGDLALATAKKTYLRRRGCFPRDNSDLMDYVSLDCIEIDPYLRAYLDEKGFRIVHDDFLTFNTFKRYDLIVMNPPFHDGDKHLLKALDLMEHGGQIVCILNAETIRNPFSAARKELAAPLLRKEKVRRYERRGKGGDRQLPGRRSLRQRDGQRGLLPGAGRTAAVCRDADGRYGMTRKRALKLIMSQGIQRNEAQRLLLIEHGNGKTNLEAVASIISGLQSANKIVQKMIEAARVWGATIADFANAVIDSFKNGGMT